jgi:hypothetical protein
VSPIPDTIDPVVGWRTWMLIPDEPGARQEWRLGSPVEQIRWTPRIPMRARCPRCSAAPDRHCSCGIYAFTTGPFVKDLGCSAGPWMPTTPIALRCPFRLPKVRCVVGEVAGWGRVIRHTKGWRAELAYPISLAVVCGVCLGDRRKFVRADHVAVERGYYIGLCAAHVEANVRPSHISAPASEIERHLRHRYCVLRTARPVIL